MSVLKYSFSEGQWKARGRSPIDPVDTPPVDPQPDPSPAGWQDAVNASIAAQNYNAIEAWYTANTGHEALGYTTGELVSGSLTPASSGEVIEGRIGSSSRPAVSNVTIRGCRIEWSSALYAAYLNPTYASSIGNVVFEYCTFVGPTADSGTSRRAAIIDSTASPAVTFRYCNFFGGTSGVAGQGGAVVEYSWIHDLAAPIDPDGDGDAPHRTSLRNSGTNATFLRNYCTDGGSSCISNYLDKEPVHDVLIQENILNGSSPNASPSYLINTKQGPYGPGATNVKYLGNMFGTEYQFGIITGGNIPWGTAGNEKAGNKMLLTGELIGND